ncbi:uncharacterized protein Socs16D isoform X3 [Eurosta solidaginis]|uniref:uncharacterized protein Socs16D isoform X3 n=1 Tax=Eurosta solidaginis TaxID=178769 RepID=UPI0035305F1A
METPIKAEDSISSIPASFTFSNSSTVFTILQMCQSSSNEYVGVPPPPHHDMTSVASVEINAVTSLSDDSGVPLTTNSSISSGDSYRIGLCKQIVESDGEVSQFDSLDNCSEGGMSAENFNTLKKGPLAPIEPPLEFQDSPSIKIGRCNMPRLKRLSSSHSSLENIKDTGRCDIHMKETLSKNVDINAVSQYFEKGNKDFYLTKKPIHSSDSILSNNTENVYDEPNNVISSYVFYNNHISESKTSMISASLPPTSSPSVGIKRSICPYYRDHTKYFKAIPSEQDSVMNATQKFNTFGLSEIRDYDLYYSMKRNTLQCENSMQEKVLYSPRNINNYCHSHHTYQGPNGCVNRPNSRNSLNSRLSSSHNSLSTSSTNKPDDSIFITQAMSHDALLTREISDFYNVPIDSDIYALPIDMVKSDKCSRVEHKEDTQKDLNKIKNVTLSDWDSSRHSKFSHKTNRNKRNKRSSDIFENGTKCSSYKLDSTVIKVKGRRSDILNTAEDHIAESQDHSNTPQEGLHKTLREVKKYYQTLYFNTGNESMENDEAVKDAVLKISNETLWCEKTPHLRNNIFSNERSITSNCNPRKKTSKTCNENNDKINNNINNLTLVHNYSSSQSKIIRADDTCCQVIRSEKKQFSLNLKQKFCSIFRIRRSQHQYQRSPSIIEANTKDRRSTAEKQKKFQSRALPPLPNKTESIMAHPKKKDEARSLQFTSSIEKVKDYGWYWGPLSSEAAEKVLSTEPDGSFIVRDSSDDHYIFSLSFKLNNCVRHVRIEQDQGTFSFGSYAKFKSQTITEFIEKAVEHSRSGRYLFFLHRRPEHGPMRVQLTNPVSRFKHVQSLQHMCRFVILKTVIRKDLIESLPLPRRLLDYLNYRQYFSEQIETDGSQTQIKTGNNRNNRHKNSDKKRVAFNLFNV